VRLCFGGFLVRFLFSPFQSNQNLCNLGVLSHPSFLPNILIRSSPACSRTKGNQKGEMEE
jgi:hypothetical protein